jgi:hypothetical protein
VADAADDDLVVPAGDGVLDGALQDREHSVQPGAAGRAAAVAHPVPGRGQPPAGEVRRQVPLRRRQHVHHEGAVAADGPQREAAEIEADQDERRVERQRGDRVGGGAHRGAVGADRGDHRDPGREVAHGRAELRGRDVMVR